MNKILMMVLVMIMLLPTMALASSSSDYHDGRLIFFPGDDQTMKYDKDLKTVTFYEVNKKAEWKITTDLFLELTPAQIKKLGQTGQVEIMVNERLVITRVFPWIKAHRIFNRRFLVLEDNTVFEKTPAEVISLGLIKENQGMTAVLSIVFLVAPLFWFMGCAFSCGRYQWYHNPCFHSGLAFFLIISLSHVWQLLDLKDSVCYGTAVGVGVMFTVLLVPSWVFYLRYKMLAGIFLGIFSVVLSRSDIIIRFEYLAFIVIATFISSIIWLVWRSKQKKRKVASF